jgi:hypothetical protein
MAKPEWGVDREIAVGSQMVELGEPGEVQAPVGQIVYVLTQAQIDSIENEKTAQYITENGMRMLTGSVIPK